ncbi:hypothetical protein GGD65_004131 [Bradyrhizobium sp. CIR18]|nr:hypothetical protein [Bradyrhizobium sp. CIR18]
MLPGVVSQQLITIIRPRDDPCILKLTRKLGAEQSKAVTGQSTCRQVERELSMMNTQNSRKETDDEEKHVSDNNST